MRKKLTLREFLKKYTAISAKFIDEYMDFYDSCEKNKYGIEINDVLDYLGINKEAKFKQRFRNNYKLNKDYIKETTRQ